VPPVDDDDGGADHARFGAVVPPVADDGGSDHARFGDVVRPVDDGDDGDGDDGDDGSDHARFGGANPPVAGRDGADRGDSSRGPFGDRPPCAAGALPGGSGAAGAVAPRIASTTSVT
jgi:hypothetical protein